MCQARSCGWEAERSAWLSPASGQGLGLCLKNKIWVQVLWCEWVSGRRGHRYGRTCGQVHASLKRLQVATPGVGSSEEDPASPLRSCLPWTGASCPLSQASERSRHCQVLQTGLHRGLRSVVPWGGPVPWCPHHHTESPGDGAFAYQSQGYQEERVSLHSRGTASTARSLAPEQG